MSDDITFHDYAADYINICVGENRTDPIGNLNLSDGKWYCCMYRYGFDMPARWIAAIASKLDELAA